MATPRGLTQPYTSFISSSCQGIHRVPLTKQHTHKKLPKTKNTKNKEQEKNNSHPTHTTHSHAGTMKLHRVHYTVLTQHTPPPKTTHTPQKRSTKKTVAAARPPETHTCMFQTPNSTPTHKQFEKQKSQHTTWCVSSSRCHKPQHQPHPSCGTHSCRGGMFHPDYKKTNGD